MRRSFQCGFTLVELLVVVVIIGIIVSFAALSLGDGGKHDRLAEEAQRLASLIELASENAVMEGREWGMHIDPDGYGFMVLVDGTWQPVNGDRMFRNRHVKDGISLSLQMDDTEVSLSSSAKDESGESGEQSKDEPQLYLMSSDERTPFKIVVAAQDGSLQLIVDAPMMGKVTVHER